MNDGVEMKRGEGGMKRYSSAEDAGVITMSRDNSEARKRAGTMSAPLFPSPNERVH